MKIPIVCQGCVSRNLRDASKSFWCSLSQSWRRTCGLHREYMTAVRP